MPRIPEAAKPLSEILDELTVPAAHALFHDEGGGKVRCFACAHRCLVLPGQRGICQVRINRDGQLRVPFGYVGALQCDPTEKKPFFHVLPGSSALTFGMLGCDLHCSYCGLEGTLIATAVGMRRIKDLWDDAEPDRSRAERRRPRSLTVLADDGSERQGRWVFRHRYTGRIIRLVPPFLPPLEVTPEHPVLATESPGLVAPQFVPAGALTASHHLAVPRILEFADVVPREAIAARRRTHDEEPYAYVPLRAIDQYPFDGCVYNLEVEGRHTYVANYVCVENCQNWLTSQALRDEHALVPPQLTSAEELADLAVELRASLIASSYNEPLITSEWAAAVMTEGRKRGLVTAYVSNGNATPEVLDYVRPHIDCYKVDLKAMDDAAYRTLGARLDNVLATIEGLKARGFWVEIVTLLVPGLNDTAEQVRAAARFLASIDPLIPWHVTAFHPDYKMTDRDWTPATTLVWAAGIGEEEGLRYVYAGNLPGRVGRYEDTRCHACGATLIRRFGYEILEDRVTSNAGNCPACGTRIPGIWQRPEARA